jgi:hypothetical protein
MVGPMAKSPIWFSGPERGLAAPMTILSWAGGCLAVSVGEAVGEDVGVVVGVSSLHPGMSINNNTRQIVSGKINFRALLLIGIPPVSLDSTKLFIVFLSYITPPLFSCFT